MVVSGVRYETVLRPKVGEPRIGGLVFALRDFGVAAALAAQFRQPGTAATQAVHGVLMLTLATAAAPMLRQPARQAARP